MITMQEEGYVRLLGTLLILLGSALLLLTIVLIILLAVGGALGRSSVNAQVLIVSGILAILVIAIGTLPGEGVVIGLLFLTVGGLGVLGLVWIRYYWRADLTREPRHKGVGVSRNLVKPLLRFLRRIIVFAGLVVSVDVVGLWIFLSYQGSWDLISFIELLTLLLLFEGALCGGIGGFMFLGFSEYRLVSQAALWPTLAGEQARGWKERRLSQQKWGAGLVMLGVSLILIGLLVSWLASLWI
ncbi:MAG: hypothetical protein JSV58_02825 [Candidatus Bathyarchaeota archaeon]|nr:MAG: hypothetical protein JSV58_02825 [Candidatus Bathyarchaeota archaeon]